jgi:protein-tyrosine-phosphatase
MPASALTVLFLSDHNAASSLIAEAVLRVEGNGRFRACSAGLAPAPAVDPDVVNFLAARQVPVTGLRPKGVRELETLYPDGFHFVIALSRAAASFASGHAWRGDPVTADWTLDAEPRETDEEGSGPAIRDAFWTLSRRIRIFASLPHRKATRHSLQNRLYALQTV